MAKNNPQYDWLDMPVGADTARALEQKVKKRLAKESQQTRIVMPVTVSPAYTPKQAQPFDAILKPKSTDTAKNETGAAVKSGGSFLLPMVQKQQQTAQQLQQFGMDIPAIQGQQAGQVVGDWIKNAELRARDLDAARTPAQKQDALAQQALNGVDPASRDALQAGQIFGNWLGNKAAETSFARDKSKLAYLGEKAAGGAATAAEGVYNNAIDLSRAGVNADLTKGYVTDTGVNLRDVQNFWSSLFGGAYKQQAQDTQAADKAVAEQLPAAAEQLRSNKAAEYAQGINERYGAKGLWALGGDIASGVGQMLPTIGVNAVTGGGAGMAWLMSSAAGNAAAQARAGGADEDTALVYGLLSGGVEVATEHLSAGIPGLNKTGLLDKVLGRVAGSAAGRSAVKKIVDVLGEGAEEYISEIAGAYLSKMWNGDDRGAWQTFAETQPDALYSGIVGALTSAVMNLPGAVKDDRAGRIIDKAADAAQDGQHLTTEQIDKANKAAQRLDAVGSKAWYDVNMSKYADGLVTLPMRESAAEAAALPGLQLNAKKDAVSAIKTDSVTGEPASIGGAATSSSNIIPKPGENATGEVPFQLPMAQTAAQRATAESISTPFPLPMVDTVQPLADNVGNGSAEINAQETKRNTEQFNGGAVDGGQQEKGAAGAAGAKLDRMGDGPLDQSADAAVSSGLVSAEHQRRTPSETVDYIRRRVLSTREQLAETARRVFSQESGTAQTRRIGKAEFKIEPAAEGEYTSKSREIAEYYREKGIPVTIVRGMAAMRADDGTHTMLTGDAQTLRDGSVIVRNDATTSAAEILNHEFVHEMQRSAPERFAQMQEGIANAGIRLTDEQGYVVPEFENLLVRYAVNHESMLELDNIEKLYEELAAQISGTAASDPEQARTYFGAFVNDYDNVTSNLSSILEQYKAERRSRKPRSVDNLPDKNAVLDSAQPTEKTADAPVNVAEKDPAKIDNVKLMLEDENAGFGNGVQTSFELAVGLGNNGVSYSKDIGRNLDAAAGKDKRVRQWLGDIVEKPFYDAKKAYAQSVVSQMNGYKKAMDELRIKAGSKESNAVMWYGEGRQKVKGGEYQDYTLSDLKRDFPESWENIQKADAVNRKMYDNYVARINAALEKIYPHPMEDALRKRDRTAANLEYYERLLAKADTPEDRKRLDTAVTLTRGQLQTLQSEIDSGEVLRNKRLTPRADYYHHAQEIKQGFDKLAQILSTRSDIDTGLVGVSDFTKPKSKWTGFMQQRTGSMNYSEDSVAAMVDYIKGAEYKINIDPVIANNRSVVKGLVEQTKNTRNANKFIEWMTEWTNDLAGKTNMIDRPFQKMLERTPMKALRWLNNRVKANAVVGNLNSAVSQFFNLPNATAYIKNPKDWAVGTGIFTQSLFGKGKAADAMTQSGFLTERYAMDKAESQFNEGVFKTPEKLANWMLTFGDEQAARLIWSSAYSQAVRQAGKGKTGIDPIAYADDITRRCVAGRGVGEVPIVQKSEMVKLIAPFQVEVNNAWQLLKERVKEKDALGILLIFLTSWLMNSVSEALTGNRVAYDPIDAIADGVKNAQDEAEQDERSAGAGDYVVSIGGRLAGETLSAMPFGSQISSSLLGLDNAVGYNAEKIFGDSDPTRYGVGTVGASAVVKPLAQLMTAEDKTDVDLVSPALNILLPWGGKQASRTLGAAQDMGHLPQGPFGLPMLGERETAPGSYSASGALRFPIDTSDPLNVLSGYAFGSYGTKEGKEYLQSGANPYSAKATEAYRAVYPLGGGDKFIAMLPMLDTNGKGGVSASEVTQGLEGHGMTPEQKAAVWQVYASDETKGKYTMAQEKGVGDEYLAMMQNANLDGKGSITQEEAKRYLDSTGMSTEKKAFLFPMVNSGWKANPYK